MNIWFTADTHFLHKNIIEYSKRPFSSLEEMTAVIIDNWNEKVKRGDLIYHLGDFALGFGKISIKPIDNILTKLNGNKILIAGNHDRKEVKKNLHWNQVLPYKEIKVDVGEKLKKRIVMCHYAMVVWNQCHRGSWMLHGHSHGNLNDIGGKILDVGVDVHNFKPVCLEEIKTYMDKRNIIARDHHV